MAGIHPAHWVKTNQTLRVHQDCATILNEIENKMKQLEDTMSVFPKQYDSHRKLNKVFISLQQIRETLDTEMRSQIHIPFCIDSSMVEDIYLSTTGDWE
jgi:hypothetical protein